MKTLHLRSKTSILFIRGFFSTTWYLIKLPFFLFLSFDKRSGKTKEQLEEMTYRDHQLKAAGQMTSDEKLHSEFFRSKRRIGIWDVLRPWHIEINIDQNMLTMKKRNWFLIGFQEDSFAFKSIRHVKMKKPLFGSDIEIRVFGGYAELYAFSKSDAKLIHDSLMKNDLINSDNDSFADGFQG
jgi:hypothetical protein